MLGPESNSADGNDLADDRKMASKGNIMNEAKKMLRTDSTRETLSYCIHV